MTTTNTVAVVYNDSFGGFGLSDEALKLYNQKRAAAGLNYRYDVENRHDIHLVEVVKELGDKASGYYASLKIEHIPIEYIHCYDINEYDGLENVWFDPAKLIAYKLWEFTQKNGVTLESLNDTECREFLLSLIKIRENEGNLHDLMVKE
jgi:hypothetical protein